MKAGKIFAAILGLSFLAPAVAEDQQMTTVWTTDFSGKPPFQRKMETVRVADLAQFEEKDTELVNTTDFSGKPPFKRNREMLRVVDLAQFEVVETENKFVPTPRRMKR